eukprot:CAMPEP_0203666672 /NCGR_PEP_ID=MMETSP0090-20130426/3676_1 /ASSEMBLY_ACC=CAM_ASM_001088 /TAXON_ID=426623 /ORGANISM="Chaetoceros affinis, Strain CCMP159" /LENGTH=948 /DNA_ID=CAMNT_0050530629 /DNA_START=96 /DNA_END=2939 /DNA_ORIENTATION=+
MGFFSNLFGGGNVSLDENIPIDSVTIDRQKKIQRAKGKENVDTTQAKTNKRKGWGRNNKKKNRRGKQKDAAQPAPKLSVFLQQIEPEDDNSLNHTVDTGSLTASITTNSISKSGSTSRPQTPVYCRPLTAPESTRPASAAGVSPPPLNESFPIDNVSENRSQSSNSTPESTGNVKLLPQTSMPRQHVDRNVTDTTASLGSSDVSSSDSSNSVLEELENFRVRSSVPQGVHTEGGTNSEKDAADSSLASSVGSNDAVEDLSGTYDEAESNADFALMLDDGSLTDVADILSPLQVEFDTTTMEQDYLSIGNSEDALENFSITSDSANEDLKGSFYLDIDESEALSVPVQIVFDRDFFTEEKNIDSQDAIQELELELELKEEQNTPENEVLKSFDEIVNEVEETIANAQSAAQQKKAEGDSWIANGLLSSLQDDSSHSSSQNSQNSSFSFTSDDFKEEDFEEEERNTPVKAGLGITTIVEEDKEDESTKEGSVDRIVKSGFGITTIVEGEKEDESGSIDPIEEEDTTDELKRSNCDEDKVKELRHAISKMMENQPASPISTRQLPEEPESEDPSEPEPSEPELEPFPSSAFHTIPSSSPVDRNIPASSPPRSLNSSITSRSIPQSLTLNNSITASGLSQSFTKSINPPKSALLSKSLPRPELKKSVSWKDETDVYTYLPKGAEELQKARDLVATYAKIMDALNAKRPSSAQSKADEEGSSASVSASISGSSSSSENISDRSASSLSSIESLLSALSHASSNSSGSVKIVIDQIKTETERMVAESMGNIDDDETEQARAEILENKWPEIVETNASSSSIESLMSALSIASLESNESMKMVVQKLKDEAERRVILSAQMESEIKEVLAKKAERRSNNDDTSESSSTFSSLAQSDISKDSSTGTSDSVKALMKQLNSERSKQANVFKSQQDMFSLLHNDSQKEEARVQIMDNDW